MAPQTPQQRRANAKYAKQQEAKMGAYRPPKPDAETRRKQELGDKFRGAPVGRWMVYLLIFVVIGGVGIELLRLFF